MIASGGSEARHNGWWVPFFFFFPFLQQILFIASHVIQGAVLGTGDSKVSKTGESPERASENLDSSTERQKIDTETSIYSQRDSLFWKNVRKMQINRLGRAGVFSPGRCCSLTGMMRFSGREGRRFMRGGKYL